MAGPPGTGKAAVSALVAVLLLASFWWLHSSEKTPLPPQGLARPASTATQAAPPEPEAASTPAPAPVAESTPAPPVLVPASNAFSTLEDYQQRRAEMPHKLPPASPPVTGRTPETELGRVVFMVRDYRAAFGSNPVGSNKEITRILLGDNERGTKFVDPSTVTVNAKGEMLDAWSHPYFFHAMSGKLMEIRSAGPDGKIFTADDLVQ